LRAVMRRGRPARVAMRCQALEIPFCGVRVFAFQVVPSESGIAVPCGPAIVTGKRRIVIIRGRSPTNDKLYTGRRSGRESKKPMHGGRRYPPTPGCFLEVLILNDFKSLSPELVILKGLKWHFSELVILKELRAKNG
jgi:hypothetical protein